MARLLRRPRSRGLGKRAWLVIPVVRGDSDSGKQAMGEFTSVPELLDEVQMRITTLEVPR